MAIHETEERTKWLNPEPRSAVKGALNPNGSANMAMAGAGRHTGSAKNGATGEVGHHGSSKWPSAIMCRRGVALLSGEISQRSRPSHR